MKARLVLFLLFGFSTIFSQTFKCGVKDYVFNENETFNLIDYRDEIIIPIVFHVVNKVGQKNNITETDIYLQLDALNKAFSSEYVNLDKVPLEFKDLIVNSNIKFCLGYRKNGSEIEKGIDFVETVEDYFGDQFLESDNRRLKIKYKSQGGLDGWDSKIYVNVWISELSRVLGVSTFHMEDTIDDFRNEAGIVIDYHTLPSKGYKGNVLVHELGHYFGLRHIWGKNDKSCNSDDGILDTPLQFDPYYGCPQGRKESCGSQDMYMNYMDYTDDNCSIMFTAGQVNKMKNVLIKYRPTLLDSKNKCYSKGIIANPLEQISLNVLRNRNISIYRESVNLQEVKINIYDINGRKIYHGILDKDEHGKSFYDISFSSGMYFITFETYEFYVTKKFIVL